VEGAKLEYQTFHFAIAMFSGDDKGVSAESDLIKIFKIG
jgi:hypothetical protein